MQIYQFWAVLHFVCGHFAGMVRPRKTIARFLFSLIVDIATLLAADASDGGVYVRGSRVSSPYKNIFVATVPITATD